MKLIQKLSSLFFLTLAGICVLFQPITAIAAESESKGPFPKVIIESNEFNFGSVPQGAIVEHSFLLKNIGEGSLIIRKLHAACGCTAVVMDKDSVAPGETAIVKVSFDTNGFQGQKEKTVRIYTNDPAHTSSILRMRGEVVPDVRISPLQLDFGSLRRGNANARRVVLQASDGTNINFSDIEAKSEELSVRIVDAGKAAKQTRMELEVSLAPTLPFGPFRSRISVKTSSKKNPIVNIPVSAVIEGDLLASPRTISFGMVEASKGPTTEQMFRVLNRGQAPVSLLSVKSDSPSVIARILPASKSGDLMLGVNLKPGASGIIRARVSIETNHPDPDQAIVTVPVYAIISSNDR